MDSVKIGSFLRELRKEKNMTQEAVAEVFSVSNRTISRWETGSNLPDISLLVEIADFYEIDIREILNGERNPSMPADDAPEAKETSAKDELQEIAAYDDENKKKMASRTRIYAMAGLTAMIIYVMITSFASPDNIVLSLVKRLAAVMVYAALSASILFTTEKLQILQRKCKENFLTKILPVLLIILGAIVFILAALPLFLVGTG